jgi:hypothetical protein
MMAMRGSAKPRLAVGNGSPVIDVQPEKVELPLTTEEQRELARKPKPADRSNSRCPHRSLVGRTPTGCSAGIHRYPSTGITSCL